MRFSIGMDFGTESVRVIVVDIQSGAVAGAASSPYRHGVIDRALPQSNAPLPVDFALQHPRDWLDDSAVACRQAMKLAGASAKDVVGIGVDFTSCTMLPALADGTPLCLLDQFADQPHAWPKLWKHHAAKSQTDRINAVARDRREPWLNRYGGQVGLEWFFPKVLECLSEAPRVYDAAQVWLEGGDWLVWQLTSGPHPRCKRSELVRSTCQAGYKACWSPSQGYPSPDYFRAVDERLANIAAEKLPGRFLAPGQRAGTLAAAAAQLLGLPQGTPVSAAIIDAHAGVPGSGVAESDTLVMVMGTSSCHMLNSAIYREVPGVAGVVPDGILPGFVGYETGQASVGDAFAWLARTVSLSHEELNARSARLSPGSGGVLAIDWLNGCRTPLMDGRLSGAFLGLTLATGPQQLYRALMEATAYGVKLIVLALEAAGVPVRQFVASGGLPAKSPLLMQIYADVLDSPIALAQSDQSVALGAAILGCIAASQAATGFTSIHQATASMARRRTDLLYRPNDEAAAAYRRLFPLYQQLASGDGVVAATMRQLRELAEAW